MPFSTSKRLHDNHTLLARYYSQLAEKFPDLKKDNPDLATMSNLAQSESNAEETDAAFQEALANFRKDYARYAMGQQAQWCGDNPAKCELEGMAARGVLTTGKIIGGTIDGVVGMAQHMGTRGNQVRDAVDVPVLGDALGVVGVAAGFVEASAVGLYHAFTDVLPSVGNALYDSVAHPEYSNMQLSEEYAAATLNVQGAIGGAKGLKAGVPRVKALGRHFNDTIKGAADAVRNGMDSNGGMIPVTGTVQGGTRTAAAAATLPPLGNGLFGPLAVLMAAMNEPPASGGGAERPQPKVPVAVMKNENGLITGYKMSDGSVMDSPSRFAVMEDTYGSDYMRSLPDDIIPDVPDSLALVDDTVPADVQLAADTDASWALPHSPLGVLKNDTPIVSAAPPVVAHPAFQGLRRLGESESPTVVDGPALTADDAIIASETMAPAGTSGPTTPRTLTMGSPSPTTTPVAAAKGVDLPRLSWEATEGPTDVSPTMVDLPTLDAAPLDVTPRGAAPLPPGGDLGATIQRPALPPPLPATARAAKTPAPAPDTVVVPIDFTATAEHAAVALPRPATPPPLPAPVALPAELPPPPAPRTPAPAAKVATPRPLAVPKGKVTSGPRIVDFVVEGKNYRVRFNERGISRITRNGQDLRNDAARAAKELLFNKIGEAKVLNAAGTPIPPPPPKVATPAPAPKVPTPVDTSAPTEAAPAVQTVVPAAASPVSMPIPPRTLSPRTRRVLGWTAAVTGLSGLAAAAIAWNNERKRVNREKAAQQMLEQQKSGRKK